VAAELSARGAHVEFAGADRIETRLVPEAGYPLHRFAVKGFQRRLSPELARSAWLAGAAPFHCRSIIRTVRPDVVFGAGGYVAGPMLLAARTARLPSALLEVDAHMGLANRLSSRLVDRIYVAFPPDGPPSERMLVTGRPLPREIQLPDVEGPAPDVLVFGGSLGASRLNAAAVAAWGDADPGFRVEHLTGDREFEQYRSAARPWYQVAGYTNALAHELDRCRLVVSRAGGSVFEIAAAGRPAILIPSPNVTADHQTANARHLERAGAAVVLPDAELTGERLDAAVRELLGDEPRLRAMGEAARSWARPDASAVIADDLLTLVGR
jgi:UDP-N-acetylglucosamine--N-acetylmuramyl-(pentapeptide) pyrophosphoryl-undecaprenol N-acetylglucosamine transferase